MDNRVKIDRQYNPFTSQQLRINVSWPEERSVIRQKPPDDEN